MKSLSFRLLGFPIIIHPMAWLILGFILLSQAWGGPGALMDGALWAAVLFGSVLVHELGHALVARRLGLGPCAIQLHGFGGLTQFGRPPTSRQGLAVSAAGPGAGLLLGVLSLALYLGVLLADGLAGAAPGMPQLLGFSQKFLQMMIFVNLFWSLFNLLPMNPLDGGKILLHSLGILRVDVYRSLRIVAIVSITCAVLASLVGWYLGYWFILIVAFFVLQQNIRQLRS